MHVQLLVSVQNAKEAADALDGGADIIDAKEPAAGALGAVDPETFVEICDAIRGARPVSAAIGDATDAHDVERAANVFASRGASFVKLGIGAAMDRARVTALLAAAMHGARHGRAAVIAAAYADEGTDTWREMLVVAAAHAGARGVLLDTRNKQGPSLPQLITPGALARWTAAARSHGLMAALAGRLDASHLGFVRDSGATIAGVRGAACDGGRADQISTLKVRALAAACRSVTLTRDEPPLRLR